MSDTHQISAVRTYSPHQRNQWAFVCMVAGRLMMCEQRYATPEGAIRAAKRWISKHGVKP